MEICYWFEYLKVQWRIRGVCWLAAPAPSVDDYGKEWKLKMYWKAPID